MKRRSPRSKQDPFEQARRDVLRYRGLRRLAVQEVAPRERGFRVVLLFITLFVFASILHHRHILSERGMNAFAYVGIGVFFVYIFAMAGGANITPSYWQAGRARRRYQNGVSFLTGTYDLRAVGPLAEIFWLRPVPSGAAGALTRLLRVQAQSAQSLRLSERQRQYLLRILTLRGDAETALQIAVLDSLAASGQTRALPAVTRLAQDATRPPTLQAAAQNCLVALQEQATIDTLRQTLLRPPHVPPAELLRPTSPLALEAPELLLRASINGDTRSYTIGA